MVLFGSPKCGRNPIMPRLDFTTSVCFSIPSSIYAVTNYGAFTILSLSRSAPLPPLLDNATHLRLPRNITGIPPPTKPLENSASPALLRPKAPRSSSSPHRMFTWPATSFLLTPVLPHPRAPRFSSSLHRLVHVAADEFVADCL